MAASDLLTVDDFQRLLQQLFADCMVREFGRSGIGGRVFNGRASAFCLEQRREADALLRKLPGNHCFEEIDGETFLTYVQPGPAYKPVNRTLHTVLLLATVLTTLIAGAQWYFVDFLDVLAASLAGEPESMPVGELLLALVAAGGLFSIAIVMILGAHECGHYFMARRYGMLVTPPFFLPAPVPPVGTFGAVIRMRSPMMHRRALLDIGLAGPIAGLVVAMPFLVYGILHSQFAVIPTWERGNVLFGDSLLTWGLTRLLLGVAPAGYGFNWLGHPFAWAGWVGLLVTALNLMPVGQLDGGHAAYALFGRRQRLVASFFVGMLLALSLQFKGWLVWCLLITFFIGIAHPPVMVEDVTLDPGRRVLGWASLVILILIFVPAPVHVF
ncbi:site-2 protease family protein [bacterium]|nr:site-2 protease family protein [bacterium]